MCRSRKSIIVGAGYIAVELAGILQMLGSDVTMVIRHDTVSHCTLTEPTNPSAAFVHSENYGIACC
jgi:thioredoxin reductase